MDLLLSPSHRTEVPEQAKASLLRALQPSGEVRSAGGRVDLSQRVQVPMIRRPLVPNTVKGMALGTKALKYWVLGPFG